MNLEMWRKYPVLIKTMWITGFYIPLIPIAVPISIAALIICYWVDKYLILRRYKRPPVLSADLNKEMTELLEIVPFMMGVKKIWFLIY